MHGKSEELKELFKAIGMGKKEAFDSLFLGYYRKLISFAFQYVKREEIAEDIVSDLFIRLWLRRSDLQEISQPRFYLYISLKNACLNHLRREVKYSYVFLEDQFNGELHLPASTDHESALEAKELKVQLDNIIENLPEQRRLIFRMVREDGLRCREVAELLDLSVRTVENQVYKAVKTLAAHLDVPVRNSAAKREAGKRILFFLFLLCRISISIVSGVI